MFSCVSRVRGGFQSAGLYDVLQVADCVWEFFAFLELQPKVSASKERQDLWDMFDESLRRPREGYDVVKVMRAYRKLTLARMISRVCLNFPRTFFKPNGIRTEQYRPLWEVNAVLFLLSSYIFTCQYPLSASRVEKTFTFLCESLHSSLREIRFELRRIRLFDFLSSAQKGRDPFFFGAKTMGAARSVWVNSITFWESIFSISIRWNSRTVGLVWREDVQPTLTRIAWAFVNTGCSILSTTQ